MLILASQSKSRAELLEAAGVEFTCCAANIDENKIKTEQRTSGYDAKETALELAKQKAISVSEKHPNAFVIGADQILELDGEWYSKPENLSMAHKHLKKLRNKTHQLLTGAVIVLNKKVVWFDTSVVSVTMRDYTDNFIDDYLAEAGEEVCDSVGAYYLEDLGAQLVKNVEGDFFSVLGLPLLPLLEALRSCGELEK